MTAALHVITDGCPCGSEFRVKANMGSDAHNSYDRWRADHLEHRRDWRQLRSVFSSEIEPKLDVGKEKME